MQYFAGLVVFSGVGSFLITDTLNFWRELKRRDRQPLLPDLLRLVFLAAMATIGYKVAADTFQTPNDWIIFLAIGLVGAVVAHLIAQRWKSSHSA